MKKKNFPTIRKDDEAFISGISPDQEKPAPQGADSQYRFLANELIPDAIWNIGGAFRHDDLLTLILKLFNVNLDKIVTLSDFNGTLPCLWSLDWYQVPSISTPGQIIETMEKYASQNVGVVLNFDNPLVNAQLLNDSMGESLVKYLFDHDRCRKNAASVATRTLANHIRKTFPKLPLHAHVNLTVAEGAQGNADHYRKLADTFQRVGIHSADAINMELMEKLEDKDKYEITVNDTCLSACPYRKQHMEILGNIRMQPWNLNLLAQRHQILSEVACEEVTLTTSKKTGRSLLLTDKEIKTLYDMGYRRFRVQSESMRNEISLAWEITRLLLSHRPELQNKVALAISSGMIVRKPTSNTPASGLSDFHFSSYT